MYWNHRVLRSVHATGDIEETLFAIHEVHYEDDGTPIAWTADPIDIVSDTLDDLGYSYARIARAFTRPVLEIDETGKKLRERTDHE